MHVCSSPVRMNRTVSHMWRRDISRSSWPDAHSISVSQIVGLLERIYYDLNTVLSVRKYKYKPLCKCHWYLERRQIVIPSPEAVDDCSELTGGCSCIATAALEEQQRARAGTAFMQKVWFNSAEATRTVCRLSTQKFEGVKVRLVRLSKKMCFAFTADWWEMFTRDAC